MKSSTSKIHHLITFYDLQVRSLRDADAVCTCGRWTYTAPTFDLDTDEQIREHIREAYLEHANAQAQPTPAPDARALADDETLCEECEQIFKEGDPELAICGETDADGRPCDVILCGNPACQKAHRKKHLDDSREAIMRDLESRLADLITLYDYSPERIERTPRTRARIEAARAALQHAAAYRKERSR